MMTRQQYLLVKLAEEGIEVAQRATKATTFGIDQVQKDQPLTNRERLIGEFTDLLAIMRMLGLPTEPNEEAIAKKIEKVESYMALSIELGTVEPQEHLIGTAVAERDYYIGPDDCKFFAPCGLKAVETPEKEDGCKFHTSAVPHS